MKAFYRILCHKILKGESIVLVTILDSKGSAPRGTGAQMMLFGNGTTEGTIGGGAIEYQAVKTGKQLFETKQHLIKEYDLGVNGNDNPGMICGGSALVLFQYLDADDEKVIKMAEKTAEVILENQNTWMLTFIRDEVQTEMIPCTETECVNLKEDEQMLCQREAVFSKEKDLFVLPFIRREKVFIFGGGHVSKELVPVLAHLDFNCIVLDDREEFVSKERFPDAEERILTDFNHLEKIISVNPQDYVIIMTRGHQHDYEVEAQMLKTSAHYIGIIGSRKKTAAINQKLRHEKGFSKEKVESVYTPIGKAIKATTPAEIAISIAAELIEVRAES